MKKVISIFKKTLCLALCLTITLSFTGCSSNKMTEENVNKTVEKVETSFKNLDLPALKKYVHFSKIGQGNIKFNIKNIGSKDKVIELGKAIFENLVIEVESVNLEEKTVTLKITNKVLYLTTDDYLRNLKTRYSYTQILSNLSDDEFVESNVDEYLKAIDKAPLYISPKTVTVKIEQDKRNLILVFDEEATDAILGEILSAFENQFF